MSTLTAVEKIEILQRFVNSFADDLGLVRSAFNDEKTPETARRALIGGLNYALDMLDIFPDTFKGIGIADDGMVLRLSAKLAKNAGATHEAVETLAMDANVVYMMFEDLAGPLEKLVSSFPDPE